MAIAHDFQGRVLIVDDNEDVCRTLAGLLQIELNYLVATCNTYADAEAIIRREYFHIAIIDVRLNDTDDTDESGMRLLKQLRSEYPALEVIMMSGYPSMSLFGEALRSTENGRQLAVDFLIKDVDFYDKVSNTVQRTLSTVLRINESLHISFEENLLEELPKRLRFAQSERPSAERIWIEVEDLMRKLFPDCTEVRVFSFAKRGFSKAIVLQIEPSYRNKGDGEVLVAKIGERSFVEDEAKRYHQYIDGMIGNHRIPRVLQTEILHTLAGIIYTFVGLGKSETFADLLPKKEPQVIEQIISNLFLDTSAPLRGTNIRQTRGDLKQIYLKMINKTDAQLQKIVKLLTKAHHPFKFGDDQQALLLGENGQYRLKNPVEFIKSGYFEREYMESIIHGDLHGDNVLIDHHNDTWVIDFGDTGWGPSVQDFVTFETFLRINLTQWESWEEIYEFNRLLFMGENLTFLPIDSGLSPVNQKCLMAIKKTRELALERLDDEVSYLIGALFIGIRVLTISFLEEFHHYNALISSALIAEKLEAIIERDN